MIKYNTEHHKNCTRRMKRRIASSFPASHPDSTNLIEKIYPVLADFFFYSVLRPFQDYFSSYETGQSVGGAKTGEPREKTPDTPACRTWLVSHVARAGLEPTPDTAVR